MPPAQKRNEGDPIADRLRSYAHYILVAVFGLLPLFFIPSPAAPFEFSKIFFVLLGVIFALIILSLLVLRSGEIAFCFSYPLIALWTIAILCFISALLSGDLRDALVGEQFSIHSAAFVGLLALTASMWTLFTISKNTVMKLYMLFIVSTIVLVLFHGIRLIFSADILSFNVFQNPTASLIGGWNDLALYLGLTVLISLLTLGQIRLTQYGRVFFYTVIAMALVMLAVINFFAVWIVLGIVSLGVLVYVLRKDAGEKRNGELLSKGSSAIKISSLPPSLFILVVSVLFIVGGSALGGAISHYTDVSYIEVRPSFEATFDIARNVYSESAFLGVGPNKFADAWRLHKDEAINTTAFWNTDFTSGHGYISTFFVTTGVLGGLAWLAFLCLFFYSGIRMLLKASDADRGWYFIGMSSFVGASYIWLMSFVYVPDAALLLIGALLTGITALAYSALEPRMIRTISLGTNRRTGFVVTLVAIAIIIGSVDILYTTAKHYTAVFSFNEAVRSASSGRSVSLIEEDVLKTFEATPHGIFMRKIAELELLRINALLALPDPAQKEQQEFQNALVNGIQAGQLAVGADKTEPANWAVLGSIYSLLVSANIDGAYERASEALTRAMQLDPHNPLRYLALAQLEVRANNIEEARQHADRAVALKPNYTDALFFLTQLDISIGDIEDAVRRTQSVIALEPNNPARYYQLGVLESSRGNTGVAIAAFEEAVRLDINYANARYFLALAYDSLGRYDDALRQLEWVLRLNPGNRDVIDLITTIETNGSLEVSDTSGLQPVREEEAVVEEDGTVVANEEPDSPLLVPVNTVPQTAPLGRDGLDRENEESGLMEDTDEVRTDADIGSNTEDRS